MMIDTSAVLQSSTSISGQQEQPPLYDLLIIGGGVVGLACLRAATLQGWNCALVEAQPDLLSQASGSNSGIVCTGVDAAPGSLERALIRDSISQLRLYCREHNVPSRPCGSLVCQWEWEKNVNGGDNDGDAALPLQHVLNESHDAGDTHAKILSKEQILSSEEPNVSSELVGAVHIPGEIVVDPWLYSISLAVHALENGADIYTNYPVDLEALKFDGDDDNNGVWTVPRKKQRQRNDDHNTNEWQLQAKAVINAAGIFSDSVQNAAIARKENAYPSWTAQPRRGQYRVYRSRPNTRITHPIQPIPTQQTKGIFVFSTMHNQLVVGPTAKDQESRTDRTIDDAVASQLDNYIQRILPNINPKDDLIGEYVGIRPGTNQRDYQIHVFPQQHWIAVAGIRSTGLTASLGIGNYVMRQLPSILGPPPNASTIIKTTPMPSLEEMVRDFKARTDGCLHIHGNTFRVTHPLSFLGFKALAESLGAVRDNGSLTL